MKFQNKSLENVKLFLKRTVFIKLLIFLNFYSIKRPLDQAQSNSIFHLQQLILSRTQSDARERKKKPFGIISPNLRHLLIKSDSQLMTRESTNLVCNRK